MDNSLLAVRDTNHKSIVVGGSKEVQKFIERTVYSINKRAFDLGIKWDGWTEEEIIYLKNNCNHMTTNEMAISLNRNLPSVRAKMSRLGIKKDAYFWSKEKIETLIKYYPTEGSDVCRRLAITRSQCQAKAHRLGIKYVPKLSKYKYVSKIGDKYVVQFQVNGKLRRFGFYVDEDEAGRVALEKAKEYGKKL